MSFYWGEREVICKYTMGQYKSELNEMSNADYLKFKVGKLMKDNNVAYK